MGDCEHGMTLEEVRDHLDLGGDTFDAFATWLMDEQNPLAPNICEEEHGYVVQCEHVDAFLAAQDSGAS